MQFKSSCLAAPAIFCPLPCRLIFARDAAFFLYTMLTLISCKKMPCELARRFQAEIANWN